MTLTIEVPDALTDLPAERLDALRADVNRYAVAKFAAETAPPTEAAPTDEPVAVTWEELTGYTDAEEEAFAARLGEQGPALAAALAPTGTQGE